MIGRIEGVGVLGYRKGGGEKKRLRWVRGGCDRKKRRVFRRKGRSGEVAFVRTELWCTR